MAQRQKLELNWIGKHNRPRLEPRILLEDKTKSHHAAERVKKSDHFENMLIKGDNLLALKALESEFRNKVKCIFIDPPYNTGSAFEHYDDGMEHSIWLGMMRDRIENLYTLLAEDGSIWITLDDNEVHYLKIVCDEIFGRQNFVRHITWQKKYSVSNNYKGIASITDHLLVYQKSSEFKNNQLPRTEEADARYSNPDNDPRGVWTSISYLNQASVEQRPNLVYEIINPKTGKIIKNGVKAWKYEKSTHETHVAENKIWWGSNGESETPRLKLFLAEISNGLIPHNWWPHIEVGHTDEATKESNLLFGKDNGFSTPKPERLLQKILTLATNPGDLVLDSFAGSGTTGAVAHKMRRRWIMIELLEHINTHIHPRMVQVVDGTDQGGISKALEWSGGGGFRFYNLAPSLLIMGQYGQWIFSKQYNPEMLAEAVCKHMGFTYRPGSEYWNHGFSTENDHIFVTTQTMGLEHLRDLSQEVGSRTLLVCCGAYMSRENQYRNLTLKKIPRAFLEACDWSRDDYSLEVKNLPMRPPTSLFEAVE